MSISSVSSSSTPLPFNYLDTNNNAQVTPAPQAGNDNNNDSADATTAQPPAPPPLPPGQGTRVNQLA
jgi:hypothetical protein